MQKSAAKTAAIAAVVVLILGGIFIWKYRPNGGSLPSTTAPSSEQIEPSSGTAVPPSNQIPSKGGKSTGGTAVTLLSPRGGERWVVNQSHTIRWDNAAGATGGIYLVDAVRKSVVGWITSQTGAEQTSYAWDTRQVFLSRNSPQKKDIIAGRQYIVKVRFDLPTNPELSSGPVLIIYPEQIVPQTYIISIRNLAFDPPAVTIAKGDTVVFKNDDLTVTYEILATGAFGPYKLAPGQSATLKTEALLPGSYAFTDTLHSSLTGKIIVQ